MDEVDEDVDGHAAAGGLGTDRVELVAGTVDQHDPAATVGGVTLLGLVGHLGDDSALVVAIDPVSHLAVAVGPLRRRRPPLPLLPLLLPLPLVLLLALVLLALVLVLLVLLVLVLLAPAGAVVWMLVAGVMTSWGRRGAGVAS